MATHIFTEQQKFRQLWLWILVLFSGMMPVAIFGVGLYIQLFKGQPFGNNPMSDNGLITAFALTLLLVFALFALFAFSTLKVRIDKYAIKVRFVPFIIKERTTKWTEVASWEVVKYNAIREYGGWGLRANRKGKAYNVSGNMGLRLQLRNGKELLIGTSQSEALKAFLAQLKPLG